MTDCNIGRSVNLVTQQFCRKTSTSSKYGNVSGSWSSIQRSASLFESRTRPNPSTSTFYGRQLDPATDYLPKPKHKQSGNHGSTTTHLPNTSLYILPWCVHQQQAFVEPPRWRHHEESQQHSVVLEQKYCSLLSWREGILLSDIP